MPFVHLNYVFYHDAPVFNLPLTANLKGSQKRAKKKEAKKITWKIRSVKAMVKKNKDSVSNCIAILFKKGTKPVYKQVAQPSV